MRFLIGLGLIILGGVLGAVTGFPLFFIVMFAGVFLFATLCAPGGIFLDYAIPEENAILARRRHYANFLPFTIVSYLLTLFRTTLVIPYKADYYKIPNKEDLTEEDFIPVSRQEYKALKKQMREVYATQTLDKEFLDKFYSTESIALKHKKTRLTIASVFAALFLTMVTAPGGIAGTLICEAIFVPMIILWAIDYKDAKILQAAYDRACAAAETA